MKQFLKISIIALTVICAFYQTAGARKKRVTNSNNASPSGKITTITVPQYKQLISDYERYPFIFKGKRPAIVLYDYYFYRENVHLEELAKKYRGKVDFYSIDSPYEMNDLYDFISVPAIILFTNTSTSKDNIDNDSRFLMHSIDLKRDGCAASDCVYVDLYIFSDGKFFRFDDNERDNNYDAITIIDDLLKNTTNSHP